MGNDKREEGEIVVMRWIGEIRGQNAPLAGAVLQEKAHWWEYNLLESTSYPNLILKRSDISGGIYSKERLSILVACSMEGCEKLPLLVIRMSSHPVLYHKKQYWWNINLQKGVDDFRNFHQMGKRMRSKVPATIY